MSPAGRVEAVRGKLFEVLHGGIGMIYKDDAIKCIDHILQDEHAGADDDDDLVLVRLSIKQDCRAAYTFRELLEIINGVEDGSITYGDVA